MSEERHQRARWKALKFSVRTLAFVKCDMGEPLQDLEHKRIVSWLVLNKGLFVLRLC